MHDSYITTSIPYVNAAPHIGHALELVQADTIARYLRLNDSRVTFQTGTDENAHKNVIAANQMKIPVQQLVDDNSDGYRRLVSELDTAPQSFIRTTESRHRSGVQKFWQAIDQSDIYEKSYRGRYCEGCEDFLSERDLADGKCPDHLETPTMIEESNYFFRLSAYQDRIDRLIASDRIRIYPKERKREVLAFIRRGLHDISVSRDASRMSGWGIPVPGDNTQVIYVWIDALINYITGIGYGSGESWRDVWNDRTWKAHMIGKNVWKFHGVYWPALLLSAGLPVPNSVIVHGFLTAEGRKISKSLGNAIDPAAEIDRFGSESLRFYLLSLSTFADGDYSRRDLLRTYNSQIAARLGSTVTRVTALCERFGLGSVDLPERPPATESFHEAMRLFRLERSLEALLKMLDTINAEIAELRPWNSEVECGEVLVKLSDWVLSAYAVGYWLGAFVPEVSKRVCSVFSQDPIRKPETLFTRKEVSI